jgi:hypothetical protein
MSEIEIYKSPDNKVELQVNLENDTIWLTQKQMADLFGIISVGYRVKSKRGTQFRQWATQRLKDYLVKLKFVSWQ